MIKIGVFGAARGRTMIAQTLGDPDAKLVAICDKYVPALESCGKFAEEKGTKVDLYTDFDEFIQADMDAVVLANYAHEHAPFAIRLMESGRHVMSEVLTCTTMKQAVELIEAVEKTGKIYMYAENYCYFNTTFEMRQRYRRGDIGELLHAEGEYIHDCSSIWPQITYGERDHWRNEMYSTFYCTHSLGPVLFATGLRPVSVTGFEFGPVGYMRDLGFTGGVDGIEMVKLENGATVKSIHGDLRRQPESINYELYGTRGNMETDRHENGVLHVYREGEKNCSGSNERYSPEFTIKSAEGCGHCGGDYFTTHYFIHQIAGDSESAKNSIDVYSAVDMCIPGILAYKSIVNGGVPVAVPNLRNKNERDAFRNDTFCAFKNIAGDSYVSNDLVGYPPIEDAVYEEVRRKWLAGEQG